MVQLLSLLSPILLISSYHLTACSSIINNDIYEPQHVESGTLLTSIHGSVNITEEHRSNRKAIGNTSHHKEKGSARSDAESNSESERLLREGWKEQWMYLVNQERIKVGVEPICISNKLNTAARRHSIDMANNDIFCHDGSDGSSPSERAEDAGYDWWTIGENIAYDDSLQDVHNNLMNSKGHRENIVWGLFTHMGVGRFTTGKTQIYWTQIFGRSNTESCSNDNNPCVDSTMRFNAKRNGKTVTSSCDWVTNKKTQKRCRIQGISRHCPFTCGTCSTCIDSSLRINFFKSNKMITRSCAWTKNRDTETRCAITGMSETCRKTCGSC